MYNVRHEKRKYKSGTKDELQRDQEVCPINWPLYKTKQKILDSLYVAFS